MKKFVFTLLLGIAFVFSAQADSFDNDVGDDIKIEFNQADQVQATAFLQVEFPTSPSEGFKKESAKLESLKAEMVVINRDVSNDVLPKLPDINNSRIGLNIKDTDTAKRNYFTATSGGLPFMQTCS